MVPCFVPEPIKGQPGATRASDFSFDQYVVLLRYKTCSDKNSNVCSFVLYNTAALLHVCTVPPAYALGDEVSIVLTRMHDFIQ